MANQLHSARTPMKQRGKWNILGSLLYLRRRGAVRCGDLLPATFFSNV